MIRNYLALIGSQVAGRLISFFWVIYLARHLGPSDYGRYATILSLTAIFATFIDFGLSFVAIREISLHREKAPRLIGLQIVQRAAFSLICSAALIGNAWRLGYATDYLWLFALASVHMTAQALATIGDTIFASYRKQFLTAILNTLHAAGWAFWGLWALRSGGGLRELFLVMAANSVFLILIYAGFALRLVRPRFDFHRDEALVIMRWSLPVGLTGLFGMVFDRADRVLLSWIQDASQVGLYNAVMTLLVPFTDMVWSASIIVLYPYMPALYRRPDDFVRAFRSILSWWLALFLPIMAGAMLFAEPIMRFVFGNRFEAGATLMPVAAVYMLFVPFHGLMARILIVQHQQVRFCAANFLAMAFNLTLNLVLIPRLGPLGCAIACASTHAVLILFYAHLGRLDIRPYLDWLSYLRLAPALALAVIVAWTVPGLPVPARLAFLCIVYAPLAMVALRLKTAWPEVRRLVAS